MASNLSNVAKSSNASNVGISGFSVYVPPHRVNLEDWCSWTGANWNKVSAVVGRSFRVKGPGQSLYTMAASSVLRLIERFDIDPNSVGMLILGTESSTDNAAGAVILRGMIDEGLEQKGLPRLARDCEVPEIKHACLGGIYGLKQALRYLEVDGQGRKAIVVSADIAEYERGSTGEPTQGAGAVAMLLEENPRILQIDVRQSGSASRYRGPDFRKPFQRFMEPEYAKGVHKVHDFPVFNGKYSTACYLDEVLSALDAMRGKSPTSEAPLSESVDRVFFHRPYRKIPTTAWGMSVLLEMTLNEKGREELRDLCSQSDVSFDSVCSELERSRDLFAATKEGRLDDDPFPNTMRVLRAFRKAERHDELVDRKLSLGA
ncbi:MAG: hydroxymethylglutaryl-CoA synthase, partial [Myxococcota bacterium]